MNIVFLLRYWPIYGGGETVTRILANKLVELGYNVSVVYLWERKNANTLYIDQRIRQDKISDVSEPIGEDGIGKSDHKKISDFLYGFFLNNRTDIIINQWIPAKIVYKAKRNTTAKLICCHNSSVYIRPKPNKLIHKIFFSLIKEKGIILYALKYLYPLYTYSDKLVMLSKYYVEDCKKLFRISNDNNKIITIYNPLTYEDLILIDHIYKKEKELLFVGRILDHVKRVSGIITIWKKLQDTGKYNDWKLTIVGEGPDLSTIKEYSTSLACTNIYFEGYQNPLDYYRRASIFLMTSSFEGWGMTLVEAQQNSCVPVAMDSYSSLHEIVKHNINGLIVPDKDIAAFVSALESLMQDNEYRLQLARKGLETCKQFSIDTVIKQWEALFKEWV